MKKIKISLKKIRGLLLNFFGIASIAAFTSCDGGGSSDVPGIKPGETLDVIEGGIQIALYGMPANFYSIKGTVTGDINGDGVAEPVPGIKITVNGEGEFTAKPDENAVRTDESGEFMATYWGKDRGEKSCILTFSDVDGEKNGSFKDKTIKVDLPEQTFGRPVTTQVSAELEKKDR